MEKINVESKLTRLGWLETRALFENDFIYSGAAKRTTCATENPKQRTNLWNETAETSETKRDQQIKQLEKPLTVNMLTWVLFWLTGMLFWLTRAQDCRSTVQSTLIMQSLQQWWVLLLCWFRFISPWWWWLRFVFSICSNDILLQRYLTWLQSHSNKQTCGSWRSYELKSFKHPHGKLIVAGSL